MRLAHVRERHAPAGAPWRLAAALPAADGPAAGGPAPSGPAAGRIGRWLDLEVARRRLLADDPQLAHNDPLFRQPVTTLDALLAQGRRIASLAAIVEPFLADAGRTRPGADDEHGNAGPDDDLVLDAADLRFGPPLQRPPSFRDFYAFEGHVATMWARRGNPIPDAWYRLPVFYFSNTSEVRGPDDAVWAPAGSAELDYELEVGALVDTPGRDLPESSAEEAIGGFFVLNDWSARDLQREETTVRLGPAKGKDFATSIGPWLVTPDELADARRPGSRGPDLAMTASVNGRELSRGTWSDARFSFGQMLARASADVALRPGDVIGSGTVGSGCLLEIGADRFGRWLEPGDRVVLSVERLGELETPVVARPATHSRGGNG